MRGVFTALVTPFDARNELDLGAVAGILREQRLAGISGVIPCGTTGESPTLTVEEKKRLIGFCIDELKGTGLKVIAGTGGNSTAETVELSRWAAEAGADGVLVVTPYYNKPSQAGLEAHFTAVADAISGSPGCEVILYNVPGRTGVTLAPATIARLARHPRIRSIKEATGNVAFTSEIHDALAEAGLEMDVLSGDDATFLPLLSVGATGAISVASNLFPRAMVELQGAFAGNRAADAATLHRRYFPLFRDLFVESNPVPVKAALALLGACDARVRPPLAPLAPSSLELLKASLARCGIQTGSHP
ncbi:MAG: 4-hydroxy-tetrahydrodipicolinate synthase [Oligoflexia bacterium]|nr:4-hydroxy-tetrahydrodipicolinate synthase [Oligoflexia bacterium]